MLSPTHDHSPWHAHERYGCSARRYCVTAYDFSPYSCGSTHLGLTIVLCCCALQNMYQEHYVAKKVSPLQNTALLSTLKSPRACTASLWTKKPGYMWLCCDSWSHDKDT